MKYSFVPVQLLHFNLFCYYCYDNSLDYVFGCLHYIMGGGHK